MEPLERLVRAAYDLGALGASDDAIAFLRCPGVEAVAGAVLGAHGRLASHRTPDEDGAIYVLPSTAPLDLSGELTCDWRDGDVW